MSAHESFDRGLWGQGSSNRSLGLVFAVVFAAVALLPLLRGLPPRKWALAVSGAFALAAWLAPAVLAPLNRFWTGLGLALHRITNPIVLGLLFYGVFTPLGLFYRRVLGKDFLKLKRDAGADTYWIERRPPGPPPESMLNQF
jgi:hypothetical protein